MQRWVDEQMEGNSSTCTAPDWEVTIRDVLMRHSKVEDIFDVTFKRSCLLDGLKASSKVLYSAIYIMSIAFRRRIHERPLCIMDLEYAS